MSGTRKTSAADPTSIQILERALADAQAEVTRLKALCLKYARANEEVGDLILGGRLQWARKKADAECKINGVQGWFPEPIFAEQVLRIKARQDKLTAEREAAGTQVTP